MVLSENKNKKEVFFKGDLPVRKSKVELLSAAAEIARFGFVVHVHAVKFTVKHSPKSRKWARSSSH